MSCLSEGKRAAEGAAEPQGCAPTAPLALRRDALLRLCLAVRWNAFDSGLFLHQAIFNHAPARAANCDKAWVELEGGGQWTFDPSESAARALFFKDLGSRATVN